MSTLNLTVERLILSQLLNNEEYTRKVLPFLDGSYFHDENEKTILKHVVSYIGKYNSQPSKESLIIALSEDRSLSEASFKLVCSTIEECANSKKEKEINWLYDTTEKFCKDKAVYNAIMESIHIISKTQKKDTTSITESKVEPHST